MSLKKFKKFDDNFNSIIKSLKPIKDKFSRQSIKHDNYFKKSSLEVLEKNLYGQKKSPENFYTSKLYRNLDYIYNISNDCYDYIENLKGIKHIPIKLNKKGIKFVKNLYNPEFETKPEETYIYNENKNNYISNLKRIYQNNKKIFKFKVYALDPGYYHPNYNYVKKRIPGIDFSKSLNSHEKFEIAKINGVDEMNLEDNDNNNEVIMDKLIDKNIIEEEENAQNNESNENEEIDKNNEKNEKNEKNENNDNNINKSRNNQIDKVGKISKKIFPNIKTQELRKKKNIVIKTLHKSNSQSNISTPIMISFNKMLGRYNLKKEKDKKIDRNDIDYKPNYNSTLPHVRCFQFKSQGSKQNHKKYIVGKILRSYNFNSYGYFVMDIKNNKKEYLTKK